MATSILRVLGVMLTTCALAPSMGSTEGMLVNSGFDQGLVGWRTGQGWQAELGAALYDGVSGTLSQCVPVAQGETYRLAARARAADGEVEVGLGAVFRAGFCSGLPVGTPGVWATVASGGWTPIEVEMTTPNLANPPDTEVQLYLEVMVIVHRPSRPVLVDDVVLVREGCSRDRVLCLHGGRFEATVEWQDGPGRSSPAGVATSSNTSGNLWFFSPDNWEILVKVLRGCAANGHWWVYAAAATDVGWRLTVVDTSTGTVGEWTHPPGAPSPAIVDAGAFPGCP